MKLSIGFIFTSICMISFNAKAIEFKEVSLEFRKFNAKISSGITKNRYSEALGDIAFATSEYEASANNENKNNVAAFKNALQIYKRASDAWEIYTHAKRVGLDDAYFIEKNAPFYCPGAKLNSIIDPRLGGVLNKCLSSLWDDADQILKDIQEVTSSENNLKPKNKIKTEPPAKK